MDQEFYRRHSMTEMKEDGGSSKTLSAAARRSFFRRKQKHKRSSSKEGKEQVALDAISTDSIPFLEGEAGGRGVETGMHAWKRGLSKKWQALDSNACVCVCV